MKKIIREQVYNKYNCKCAYCGEGLEYKNMQVDHIIPQIDFAHFVKNKHPEFVPKFLEHLTENDINHIDNLNPSCRQCNFYKSAHRLEYFRKLITTLHERIMKPFISRLGAKYGIIQINDWDGKFYFEKFNPLTEKK